MKKLFFTILLFALANNLLGQEKFQLKSPDGKLVAAISLSGKISYTVSHEGDIILSPSNLSMEIDNGIVWGRNSKLINAKTKEVNHEIDAHFYKKRKITDHYNELILNFKEDFNLIF